MSRKAARSKSITIQLNEEAIEDYSTGRTKKKFTEKDLKLIKPITQAQADTFEAWNQDKSLILSGSAGTGKSLLALYLSLREVLTAGNEYHKVVIVRSPTPTKDIGALPGELDLKQAVYEAPYDGLCSELFSYSKSYENLKRGGYIEFCLTSFIRGITLNNSLVIFDEAASANLHEIDTVVTRLGKNSKIIICGDVRQSDLRKGEEGMSDLLRIAAKTGSFEIINFLPEDIVRSGLVKEWIIAREELGI